MAVSVQQTARVRQQGARETVAAAGALALLFVSSVVVYAVLGRRQPLPLLTPDEFLYGHLARSVALGQGFTWRGQEVPMRSALLVRALAPFWHGDSLTHAYETSKIVGSVAVSTVVLPVWLLARRYMRPLLALVPALLTVLGTWMLVAAGILTEVLAFPLAVAALACLARHLADRRLAWGLAALVLMVAGIYARTQLAMLLPIALGAVLAVAVADPGGWRAGLRSQRVALGITGGLTAVGLIVAFADVGGALGSYSVITSDGPSPGDLFGGIKDQASAVLVLSAIVPLTTTLAGSLDREVWRRRSLAALLGTTWAAVIGSVLVSGYFVAAVDQVHWSIERYVMYPVPLLLTSMVVLVVHGLVPVRRFAIAGGVLSLACLAIPGVRLVVEEHAQFATAQRVGDVLGTGAAAGALVLGLLLTGAGALILWRVRRGVAAAACFAVLVGAALLVQSQAAWHQQITSMRTLRTAFPRDLSWLDHNARGSVARVVTLANSPKFDYTDFFNSSIDRVYVSNARVGLNAIQGGTCMWKPGANGTIAFDPSCGPAPQRIYLDDDYGKLTLYGARDVVSRKGVGRVVDVPAGTAPRAQAIVYVPCGPPTLTAQQGGEGKVTTKRLCYLKAISGQLHLDRPGKFVLTFRGGQDDSQIVVGNQAYPIPAGRVTKIPFPIGAVDQGFEIGLGWTGPPPQAPDLVGAALVQDGRTTELLR